MKEAEVIPINPSPEPRRYKGTISMTDERGFGFITSKEIPYRRIFFYWSALLNNTKKFEELRKGDEVTFEAFEYVDKLTQENKGWRAIKIEVVSS